MATGGEQGHGHGAENGTRVTQDGMIPRGNYTTGYDALFCPELEKKYECPICLRAMRSAMQTSCGHRFCEACIMTVVNQRLFAKCPVDNMWFRCTDELFPDNAVRREILSLTVKCSIEDCLWTGELRDLENHNAVCEYKWVTCIFGCLEKLRRHDLPEHADRCELRPVLCQHCDMSVTYNYLMKHQVLECDKFPVQCTLCGESGIQRESIQRHLDKDVGTCPQIIVPCQYKKYGCTFQGKRQMMTNHMSESAGQHLDYVVGQAETLNKKLDDFSQQMLDLNSMWKQKFTELNQRFSDLSTQQRINYTGKTSWKIQLTDQLKYFSDPFYTGAPGYNLHAVLELSRPKENVDSGFTSLFVVFEEGKFDDELFFPMNALCKVTVLGQEPVHETCNYSDVIPCTNVPRCKTYNELFNTKVHKRGKLKFIDTRSLLSPKYCVDNVIFIQLSIKNVNEI